jgi:putative tricarboxylic transport membrane protein
MGWDTALFADLLLNAFTYWWIIIPAILLGTVVGAVPGFNAANTIIILLPMTLAMDVEPALIFMMALYCASQLGNGIPAILLNIPGSGGAAATALDGYPMAQKGEAHNALIVCFVASVVGGLIGTAVVIAFLPYLARVGLMLHSVEMVVIMLFGLTLIAVIAARDMVKGLFAGLLGLLIGAIGTDHVYSTPRATFGLLELYDGVPLVPALIGLFAVSEALVMIERYMIVTQEGSHKVRHAPWSETLRYLWESIRYAWLTVWTSLIGVVVGMVPGAGASIAAFVAYSQARAFSRQPDRFGTGIPEGVVAPEAANNGVTSGTLVPLMAIGVPGGATAAIMMIVLQYHGVILGPQLFINRPELAYGVFLAMLVAYLFMIVLVVPMARYMARVTVVPTHFLVPLIIGFTTVGAFAPRGFLFDMGLALIFGVLGYVARKTGYHVTAILIGIILGPLFEQYLMRSLRISQGDPMILFSSNVANALWVALVLSLLLPIWRERRKRRAEGVAAGE